MPANQYHQGLLTATRESIPIKWRARDHSALPTWLTEFFVAKLFVHFSIPNGFARL
jgi:hypothetical protein